MQSWEKNASQEAFYSSHLLTYLQEDLCSGHSKVRVVLTDIAPALNELTVWWSDRQTNNYIRWCMCNKQVATWCRGSSQNKYVLSEEGVIWGGESGMALQTRWCLSWVFTAKYFNNSFSVWFVCLLASFTSVGQLVYYCDSDEFLEVKINNNFFILGFWLKAHTYNPSWTSETWGG